MSPRFISGACPHEVFASFEGYVKKSAVTFLSFISFDPMSILLSIIMSLLLVTLSPNTVAQSHNLNPDPEKLDQYLESAAKEFRFNGVALVAHKGKPVLHKAYGWRHVKNKIPHDTTSIFQIASLTKQFTATVILKLQENDKLKLSDPLSRFIPEYPNGDKITVHHLLTHTSGIPDYMSEISPLRFLVKKTIRQESVLNLFKNKPLAFEPGTGFLYSNSGYYLLGMIIEKVTGKLYEEAMREFILRPLEMYDSGFDFRGLEDDSKSKGYSVFYRERQTEARDLDSTVSYAAGGLYSTTNDLFKWTSALASRKLLSDDSWKQILTPMQNNYACGFIIDSLYGSKCILHTGSITNFRSLIIYFPAEELTIILLNNTPSDVWSAAIALAQLLFQQEYPWGEKPDLTLEERALQKFTGTYSYDKGNRLTISLKEGKLQLNGTPSTGVYNTSLVVLDEKTLYSPWYNLRIEIIEDDKGNISGFISKREGFRVSWNKTN